MTQFEQMDLSCLALALPDEVLNYRVQGNFKEALAAIDRWLLKPVGEEMKQRLRVEREILRQLPGQFPYTERQALEAVGKIAPGFDAGALKRREQAGLAEWIFLDGEKHYIHNLVRNLSCKDPEIRKLCGEDEEDRRESLALQKEIGRLKKTGESSWRFRMRASVRLKDGLFTPGMQLRAHLPIPAELHQISGVKICAHTPCRAVIDPPDARYRAICLEDAPQENREFFVEYEYTVKSDYRDLWANPQNGDGTSNKMAAAPDAVFLAEQLPHIRFTPCLRSLADEITRGADDPLAKAADIYDYVTKNVKYSFMRDYFLIPDIPEYCARNLRGDCGVQALLFITLCRISGIPAAWQSGLYAVPGETEAAYPLEAGAHDWAMFWTEQYGWRYADPSFGGSAFADGDEERRRFYFGNLDPFRMAANNAFMQPYASPRHFLPADPCDNQCGELETDSFGCSGGDMEQKKLLLSAERI